LKLWVDEKMGKDFAEVIANNILGNIIKN